jgi:hypothetical protein
VLKSVLLRILLQASPFSVDAVFQMVMHGVQNVRQQLGFRLQPPRHATCPVPLLLQSPAQEEQPVHQRLLQGAATDPCLQHLQQRPEQVQQAPGLLLVGAPLACADVDHCCLPATGNKPLSASIQLYVGHRCMASCRDMASPCCGLPASLPAYLPACLFVGLAIYGMIVCYDCGQAWSAFKVPLPS